VNFADVKLVYVFSCFVLGLIILSPTLFALIPSSKGEQFSELYVLGPNRMLKNIPSSVKANSLYTVYLGVGNHMGQSESYLIYAKLRNQTEPLPDSNVGEPSSLVPVFEYRMVLSDGEVWEKEVSFSFEALSFDGNVSRVSGLSIDGHSVSVDKIAVLNEEKNGFFYQLFFELWIYNATRSSFEFHNRSVGFTLNLTETQ
jgi:hypothetical protein